MDRRRFIKGILSGAMISLSGTVLYRHFGRQTPEWIERNITLGLPHSHPHDHDPLPFADEQPILEDGASQPVIGNELELDPISDEQPSYLAKIQNFDASFNDDVWLTESEKAMLNQTLKRINSVKNTIGFGNFNVVSFDEALRYGRSFSSIGEFTAAEIEFMEQLFYDDVSRLGFFGSRVTENLTDRIKLSDVDKIPRTGHYLYKGDPLNLYNKLREDVGDTIILTSGVRSVMKQFQLFMNKVVSSDYNISRASRSLAPPAHTFHSVGDFDVGKVGFGLDNFTNRFAETEEYRRMIELGYIEIRYTTTNRDGVRYEPWHVRV
ncbi:M15 family metallopeptidase [Salinibius halmophilus]|uniref:M15 family metallopeptidase n=1 Tax=Salinibius halmophilus TaxID=1853216 RepID=UPI0013145BF8|nr:M15 family metallopeptidase [Salinibius halmophilus]